MNFSTIIFKILGCIQIVLILFSKCKCCQPFSLLLLPGLVIYHLYGLHWAGTH